MGYDWDFTVVLNNPHVFAEGLYATLKVFVAAIAIGLPLGLVLALMRLSRFALLSAPVGVLIEVLRATPGLVLLFWVFFALPILLDVQIGPYAASVAMLATQSAAFFAEVFRGGILSVERGQWEAARAIAMSPGQVMRRVVLPQAVKRMIPAFFERAIELLKGTALVSTVSYADLMFRANELVHQSYRPLEVYTAAALLYFLVIWVASLGARGVELRLARSGESGAR
jgi:polar amino acid transport system permease protein